MPAEPLARPKRRREGTVEPLLDAALATFAALREHLAGLHARLTRMVEDVAARAGLTLSVPAESLVRILVALHDGLVVGSVATGNGATTGSCAVPELEQTALLLLLRAATTA